ncbi:unnamed protein product [marine sediment metagenome]|uniref:Uncharacterized protein n=1 Tax=marine sediment metagenome TaxID=412755 RepID=X1MQ42_9ZZZZ
MLVSGSRLFTGLKRRPAQYKASDAAFPTGGNRGGYIAWLPRQYPKTSQQRKVSDVAHACGIKPGMKKAELQKAMVDCVGPKMRK